MNVRAPYDPTDASYTEEKSVRDEMSRVFDQCHECRRCVDLCDVFPTLFDLLDVMAEPDAGRMTPADQDRVATACFHCERCSVACPYTPERHESAIDLSGLMLRTAAMHHRHGQQSLRHRVTSRVLGSTDGLGRAAGRSGFVRSLVNAPPGATARRIARAITGVTADRLLAPHAQQRFSTWFSMRDRVPFGTVRGRVTIFPSCTVEYQDVELGADLVSVYLRNGVECSVTAAGCCGAPYLYAGDLDRFRKIATRNVAVLAGEMRDGGDGRDVVVPQPTCSRVLRHHYPAHLPGPDAESVARRTFDASEYLLRLRDLDGRDLDTNFAGEVPDAVVYHAACHLRSQPIGLPGRDLIELTGAAVTVVDGSSSTESRWGLRAEHDTAAAEFVRRLGADVTAAEGLSLAGDCGLATTAIEEQTGRTTWHPLQLLARAYGAKVD